LLKSLLSPSKTFCRSADTCYYKSVAESLARFSPTEVPNMVIIDISGCTAVGFTKLLDNNLLTLG
jgi:hypothetical protein